MALETPVTTIDTLVASNPASTDGLQDADNHIRNVKSALLTTFPNITGAMTSSHTELNVLDGITSSTAELNLLDGVTATTAEINYLDGVTSNIQTQIDGITTDLSADTSPQLSGRSILTVTRLLSVTGRSRWMVPITCFSNTAATQRSV